MFLKLCIPGLSSLPFSSTVMKPVQLKITLEVLKLMTHNNFLTYVSGKNTLLNVKIGEYENK